MASTRRLAAIMFTDIVGYTSLMGSDEKEALNALQKNRKIHKSLLKKFNGAWLKEMGDGILARFPTASDAVYCAGAIMQKAEEGGIRLRIGIHMGEIVEENGDVFGDGVNIASRIESLAEPGRIYISDAVARNVRNKAGIDCTFWAEKQLKHVDEPVRIYILSLAAEEIPESTAPPYRFPRRYSKAAVWVLLLIALGGIYSYKTGVQETLFSSSAIVPSVEKSIAVLPFLNLTPEQDNSYFSEGIAEDIRSHLSLIPGVRLISRTSVQQYKNTDKDIPTIGRELGSRYIVEGSVRKGNEMARTVVRLIDSKSDEELWSAIYNQPITAILEVQNEISKKIASELRVNFVANVNFPEEISPEAYNQYLRGRHLWQTGNPNAFDQAITHYEQALAIDPEFALAHAGLADLYLNYAHLGRPSHEVFPLSVEAALRALEINENLAEAHTAYADCMYHYEYNWKEAEERFNRALELNPNYSPALWWYSGMLSAMGRHDKAIEQIEKAIQLDPLNVGLLGWSGKTYYWAGDEAEARRRFDTVRSMLPSGMVMIPYLWVEYYQSSGSADLIPVLEQAIPRQGFSIAAKTALALAYIDNGQRGEAEEIAGELDALPELTQPHFLALIYTRLGEYDRAFQTLEEAYQKRDAALIWINVNPGFNPLKEDPRFDYLLARMNLD